MMKKILVVLLVLVLVAWLGITWFVGAKTEELLLAQLEKLAKNPKVDLSSIEYERGIFSSTATAELAIDGVDLGDDGQLGIRVFHGPIAFTPDGVKICVDHVVVTHGKVGVPFETDGEDEETIVPGVVDLAGGSLSANVKFNRDIVLAYQNPKVEFTTNGETIQIDDFGLEFTGGATDGVLTGSKRISFGGVKLPPYEELAEAQKILSEGGEFAIEVGGLQIESLEKFLRVQAELKKALKNNEVRRVNEELDPMFWYRLVRIFQTGLRFELDAKLGTTKLDFRIEYTGSGNLIDAENFLKIVELLDGSLEMRLDKGLTELSPKLSQTIAENIEKGYILESGKTFVSSIQVGDGLWKQNGDSQPIKEWLSYLAKMPLFWDQIGPNSD
ncbi:MAG: hypothetical protein ACI8UO_000325 [Verrucomicrobiales bacterium]|jgi:hypothetical protein